MLVSISGRISQATWEIYQGWGGTVNSTQMSMESGQAGMTWDDAEEPRFPSVWGMGSEIWTWWQ